MIRADKSVEMLSLGFRVTPHFAPPTDQTGISSLKPGTWNIPSEKEIAVEMATVAATFETSTRSWQPMYRCGTALRKAKAELLSAAGFDADAYRKWVADGELEAC